MAKKRKRYELAPHPDAGMQAAIDAVGGRRYMLARKLRITQQAISLWYQVPLKWLLKVEKVTGVDRRTLRPDLFHYE